MSLSYRPSGMAAILGLFAEDSTKSALSYKNIDLNAYKRGYSVKK